MDGEECTYPVQIWSNDNSACTEAWAFGELKHRLLIECIISTQYNRCWTLSVHEFQGTYEWLTN